MLVVNKSAALVAEDVYNNVNKLPLSLLIKAKWQEACWDITEDRARN